MPSDEAIFKALWRPFDAFRSAVAVTIEQVRGQVADAEADDGSDEATTEAELGVFAAGRIDMDRFAAVAAREKVDLAPGETKTVRFELDEQDLAFYDPAALKWVVEPGAFEILVGSSSRDIRLQGVLVR